MDCVQKWMGKQESYCNEILQPIPPENKKKYASVIYYAEQ